MWAIHGDHGGPIWSVGASVDEACAASAAHLGTVPYLRECDPFTQPTPCGNILLTHIDPALAGLVAKQGPHVRYEERLDDGGAMCLYLPTTVAGP